MDKRIKSDPSEFEAPFWLTDATSERVSPEVAAERDAKDVSEKIRPEIARKILELTHSA